MNHIMKLSACTVLLMSACSTTASEAGGYLTTQSEEFTSCIRTIQTLDEGTWAYMGTIATLNGKFRTYETTSVHTAVGDDTWSSRSFGGNVGPEQSEETSFVKLVGHSVIPLKEDTLDTENAVKYMSCKGPDVEGRYEATTEYPIPQEDGSKLIAKNVSWYSEHGSYFAEDVVDETGRIVARRSGVYTAPK